MIKVLIVDDEKLERVLIKKGFNWEENGFEIIGEANSGKSALEFIENNKPDLILTDINMPQMDGIELTEKIFSKLPDCYVVIITGYREFEYARKAIKLGVEDFLLKPVNIQEIEKVVTVIKNKIYNEREQINEIENWKKNLIIHQDIIMENFFQKWTENRVSEEEAVEKLEGYGLLNIINQCVCVNIRFRTTKNNSVQSKVDNVVEIIKNKDYDNAIFFVNNSKNIVIYFMNTKVDNVKMLAEELLITINQELKLKPIIGMSRSNLGFGGVYNAFKQAKNAVSAVVTLGVNEVLTYDKYKEILNRNSFDGDKPANAINWEDFDFSISNCLVDKVEYYIDTYIVEIKSLGVVDKEYLGIMGINMLSRAGTSLLKKGQSISEILGDNVVYEEIKYFNTISDLEIYLKKNISIILKVIEKKKTKQLNKTVSEAIEYINNEIFNPELSLKVVANQIYSNESYLSRIFKKEVGISFIEYITKKRIDKSIELLNTTDLKVYEIAEQVGFRESHYFSICFKKQTGLTIKEFKKDKYRN